MGHIAKNCYSRQTKTGNGATKAHGTDLSEGKANQVRLLMAHSPTQVESDATWIQLIGHSGATHHVVQDKSYLKNVQKSSPGK